MSYVERRRFLWILLLAALMLLAFVANATTLARMRFEELARQATAVARLALSRRKDSLGEPRDLDGHGF